MLTAVLNDKHLGDLHGLILSECVDREILTQHQVGQVKAIIVDWA